jgi:PAS domain S-box-containing protein
MVVLAAAIAVAGRLYFRQQQREFAREASVQLAVIADLKAGQIARWYQDRRADANVILHNPMVLAQARRFLAGSSDAQVRENLLGWMSAVQQGSDYGAVALIDSQGTPRLVVPSGQALEDPHFAELRQAVARSGSVLFTDLHRDRPGRPVHMGAWIPIGGEPAVPSAAGAFLLLINPQNFLYPLIGTWPTLSGTAETYLVRREGEEVVYLNDLRHRANTALSLRFPVSTPDLPAGMAARGQEGIVQGVDYRGVPVLAALHAVPGTPWFMVAKIDREEVFAPLRRQTWLTDITVVALMLVATLSVSFFWKQRNLQLVSRQLAAERERQTLAERVAYLTKYANDIMLFADQDWRIVEANDRAVEVYGYSHDELRRLAFRDLRAPESREAFDREAKQLDVQHGMIVETVHQRKDGSTFPVESSMRTIELDGQRFHQAILRDITDRKRADAELRASETHYRNLVEHLPQRVFIKDRDLAYLSCNTNYARDLGIEPAEVVGKDDFAFYSVQLAERYRADDRAVMGAGTPKAVDEPYRLGEEDRWIHTLKVPYHDEQGAVVGVLGIFEDITERKQAETELRRHREQLEDLVDERSAVLKRTITQLEDANEELEAFAYSVSHDLRTPLRAIDGYSRMLLDDCGEQLDGEGKRLLGVVRGSTARMSELIDDILMFSRTSRQALTLSTVNVDAVCREVVQELTSQTAGRHIRFETGPLPPARGDRAMIREIWRNLLGNAVKFTRDRDPAVIVVEAADAEAGAQEPGGTFVTYRVRDNGVGFDMRYAGKLFGVFQRLHHDDEFEGTGVGLAVVKRIVTRHGGRVGAEGDVNRGATVWFTLPRGAKHEDGKPRS